MMSVAIAYDTCKLSVLPSHLTGIDPDFTAPSSDIEFQINEGLSPFRCLPKIPNKKPQEQLFNDPESKVTVDIELLSKQKDVYTDLEGIAKGSSEELFIKRHQLHNAIQIAQSLIEIIFEDKPQLSYEYCYDTEGQALEWLDINLHYQVEEGDEIEQLLDCIDTLNEKFSIRVDLNKELLLSFHLDIV